MATPTNDESIPSLGPADDVTRSVRRMRFLSLDMVKGVGVLSFILWHAMAYFHQSGAESAPAVRFTHYATGLFVFVTGFILGLRGQADKRPLLPASSVWRASRLLLICLAAGIAKQALQGRVLSSSLVLVPLWEICSLGMVSRWDVPLQVLVVIAAVLLLAPFVVEACRGRRFAAIVFAAALPLALEPTLRLRVPYLWHFLLLGVWGTLIGVGLAQNRERALAALQRLPGPAFAVSALAYLWLQLGVTTHEAWYVAALFTMAGNLASVVINVCFWGGPTLVRHDLGGEPAGGIVRVLALLGRHSLFAYVLQIVALNAVRASGLATPSASALPAALVTAAIAALCLAACSAIELARRLPRFEIGYRTLFA
ncbi:acyltransferase [Paludisphaera rhizosphaerae]|uniref:acyltransferase n=1 Tax=Paludisphaera rhizosphaerae TaxID=2711216 RepID=UPI0013EB3019|nr:acyltransferase [Paludisphaera rhizosphaerae]